MTLSPRAALMLVALSTALPGIGRAAPITVTFGGVTSSFGGHLSGGFVYDPASAVVNGLHALTSLDVSENEGINVGGPYDVPQQVVGISTPGSVLSVPRTNGSVLAGTLDMTYENTFGEITFDLVFGLAGTVSGTVSIAAPTSLTDTVSGLVTYYLPAAVPEPGALAVLAPLAGLFLLRAARRSM